MHVCTHLFNRTILLQRRSKQLKENPLHVLTDVYVLVLVETDQDVLFAEAFRSRPAFNGLKFMHIIVNT